MNNRAVVCLTRSAAQADAIVNQLKTEGFLTGDISVIANENIGSGEIAMKDSTKAPEGAAAGAGAGGLVGGALGLLVGIGSITIPGLGLLIAAGPILAALSGAAVGAAVGGLTGALVGIGVPEYEAKIYEGKIKEGKILLAVHTDDDIEVDHAKQIFKDAGAESISVAAEERVI